jgi:hypothetical protein
MASGNCKSSVPMVNPLSFARLNEHNESFLVVFSNDGGGKSPIMGRFPNMGRCIISYQEVLRSEFQNVNH